jgi:hypothetical protein
VRVLVVNEMTLICIFYCTSSCIYYVIAMLCSTRIFKVDDADECLDQCRVS